jgi:hypothetical protein
MLEIDDDTKPNLMWTTGIGQIKPNRNDACNRRWHFEVGKRNVERFRLGKYHTRGSNETKLKPGEILHKENLGYYAEIINLRQKLILLRNPQNWKWNAKPRKVTKPHNLSTLYNAHEHKSTHEAISIKNIIPLLPHTRFLQRIKSITSVELTNNNNCKSLNNNHVGLINKKHL